MSLTENIIEWLLIGLARCCTGILVYGQPAWKPGARIYFANHTSHLDLMVILSVFPHGLRARLHPLAALDYWNRGPFRRYLSRKVFRCVLLDRRNPSRALEALQEAAKLLKSGDSILIFPEGTRGNGEKIGRFHSGLHHLLRLAPEIPLVPLYLGGLARALPKGEFLPAPNMGKIVFGPELHWKSEESREDFLDRCHQALLKLEKISHGMADE